jgi:hypothetical protein
LAGFAPGASVEGLNTSEPWSKMVCASHPARETFLSMRHFTATIVLLPLTAALVAGCTSNNTPTNPDPTTPVAIVEVFDESLNVNGARTHVFRVDTVGTVTARIATLSDPAAIVGLSMGTWNGAACQILLANDAASMNITLTGTAQSVGQFCARVYDVGRLANTVGYSLEVTHY